MRIDPSELKLTIAELDRLSTELGLDLGLMCSGAALRGFAPLDGLVLVVSLRVYPVQVEIRTSDDKLVVSGKGRDLDEAYKQASEEADKLRALADKAARLLSLGDSSASDLSGLAARETMTTLAAADPADKLKTAAINDRDPRPAPRAAKPAPPASQEQAAPASSSAICDPHKWREEKTNLFLFNQTHGGKFFKYKRVTDVVCSACGAHDHHVEYTDRARQF